MSWEVGGWLAGLITDLKTRATTGGVPIVRKIQRGTLTLSEGAGSVTLSGFTNVDKMLVIINGNGRYYYRGSDSDSTGMSESTSQYAQSVYLLDLSTTQASFKQSEWSPQDSYYSDWYSYCSSATISYQIIEFW